MEAIRKWMPRPLVLLIIAGMAASAASSRPRTVSRSSKNVDRVADCGGASKTVALYPSEEDASTTFLGPEHRRASVGCNDVDSRTSSIAEEKTLPAAQGSGSANQKFREVFSRAAGLSRPEDTASVEPCIAPAPSSAGNFECRQLVLGLVSAI